MWRAEWVSLLLTSVLAVAPQISEAQQGSPPPLPEVVFTGRHDISPPLRDIPVNPARPALNKTVTTHIPWERFGGNRPTISAADPLRQTSSATTSTTSATPTATNNFEGISDDDNAAVLGFRVVPPDTEGDVGANHYVQMINLTFAVYDKSGIKVFGPVANNTLWSGFGGPCDTNNDGDPIVLYDHLADRWIFSQFAIKTHGYQCFAISTGPDPTGPYYRYQFRVTDRGFNDYPKLGVWPDGYYYTANEFNSGGQFRGAIAVAFEREKMLAGLPAVGVKFGPLPCLIQCYFSLQPSHLEGPAPPPGTPNTFVMAWDDQTWGTGGGPDGYQLWDFSANWLQPTSSTFTYLGLLPTSAPFDANLCNYSRACIPQPSPGEKLDSFGQFTMYRAQYRNFVTYRTLVLNHTVNVGNDTAGIRWTELRNSGGGWTLYQTGTYAPSDGLHRWMGSAAMDQAGNIALGYSVSGTNGNPSIRYNSRAAGDTLGTLPGGEATLITGGGVQTSNSYNRWGDYSTMSVDPLDGCTFWYTQEYYANSGSFDFKTRIGSFKLSTCGSPVHDVAVTSVTAPSPVLVNTTQTVSVVVANQGNQPETFSVSLSDSLAATISLAQSVTLGAGASTTVNFNWNPTATGSHLLTATATLATDSNAANNSKSATSTVRTAGDVAVTSVSAPASVTQGTTANISVTVANSTANTETFTVSLTDTPPSGGTAGSPSAPQTITLAGNSSTTLNFTWNTSGASTGTHTLTATASTVFGETNTANNSNSTASLVTAPPAGVTVTGISPNSMPRGTTISVTVSGTNFASGASLTFQNGPGATPQASSVQVPKSTTITATVTVGTQGPPRNRVWDVRVTNTDGSSGVLTGGFTVTP